MDAAGRLLIEDGYAAMTTLAVAKAAGVSKRDLYAFFPSKEALLAALVEESVDTMVAPVRLAPPEDPRGFYAGLAQFGRTFLAGLLDPRRLALYRLAIAEASTSPQIARTLLEKGRGATVAAVSDYFAAATHRGLVSFPNVPAAMGAYLDVLMGDLQIGFLLAPDRRADPALIEHHVRHALLVVQALDGPASARARTV